MKIEHFVLALPIFAFFFICLIRMMYFGNKLYNLMMNKHTEEWKKQTILGLGPGFSNPFRTLPFLFNKEDFGDKEVLICKIKFRNALLLGVICVPALFFTDILLKHIDKLK